MQEVVQNHEPVLITGAKNESCVLISLAHYRSLWHNAIDFFCDAWADYLYWQTADRKTFKRINLLIQDIQREPFAGIGKLEALRFNLSGVLALQDGGIKICPRSPSGSVTE